MWWLWACAGRVALQGETGATVPVDDTTPEVLSTTACDACGGDCLLEELSYAVSYHTVVPIDYADTPPAGGPHHPCWTTFGVHTDAVEDEHWVHNLEHGGVALLHGCSGCDADVASLEGVATSSPFGLALPYPDMEQPFTAVSWGWRLTLGCWDEEAVATFLAEHENRAPESVLADPGANCM
ncbi:MAG: DUF3105 domain-containing protein [Alphaproteobacteria bacterium]|nr:DUF3105 domain-containing protein [Alphaproteobacteria bacterium]MCB9695893.1 DUF3105 domain-containing protein [Alphaproteobacteria bacterium]